jgi:G patch domain-containing protein 1
MTEWERQRERNEFARTRQVYQPLAVSLSTRFTREADSKKKEESPEPDSVQAARANMFGVLTRQVIEWHPHPVLCKRFNIPDPYPNDGLVGTVTEKHKQSSSATKQIQFLPVQKPGVTPGNQEPQAAAPETFTPGLIIVKESRALAQHAVTTESEKASTSNQTEPVHTDKNESAKRISDALGTEHEEVKEEARPPMDLFKAIFAGSSSSESEAEANKDEEEEERPSSQLQKPAAIVSGNQKEEGRDERRPRKTRWQDLSAVASRPLTRAADLHRSSAGKLAGTVSENAAAIDRETVQNGDQTEPMINAEEKRVFGPALPPGLDSSEAEEKEDEEMEARHISRHKHKHHKSSSSSRKEKRRNHKESSNEEAHSHRRRKEKKKSKNKH